MNTDLMRKIGAEIVSQRMRVPVQNRSKFDVESRDTFDAIGEANLAGDDEKVKKLLDRWMVRAEWMATVPSCYLAPPLLIRKVNETTEEYLNRCYEAGKGI